MYWRWGREGVKLQIFFFWKEDYCGAIVCSMLCRVLWTGTGLSQWKSVHRVAVLTWVWRLQVAKVDLSSGQYIVVVLLSIKDCLAAAFYFLFAKLFFLYNINILSFGHVLYHILHVACVCVCVCMCPAWCFSVCNFVLYAHSVLVFIFRVCFSL